MSKKDTANRLYSRLHRLGFRGEGSPYNGYFHDAELSLHELAHFVTLPKTPEHPRNISKTILAMHPQASDWNELNALAVERLVARFYGFELSTSRLAKYATQEMKCPSNHYTNAVAKKVDNLIKTEKIRKIAQAAILQIGIL